MSWSSLCWLFRALIFITHPKNKFVLRSLKECHPTCFSRCGTEQIILNQDLPSVHPPSWCTPVRAGPPGTSWSCLCWLSPPGCRPANLWESKTVFCDPKNCIFPPKIVFYNKNHILRWKKVFLRAERASRARSPFGRGPGTQGPWKHTGFRCSLVQS